MKIKEIINSWGWRIKRLGMSQDDFAKHIGMQGTQLSRYLLLKQEPRAAAFEKIEGELIKLETQKGLSHE